MLVRRRFRRGFFTAIVGKLDKLQGILPAQAIRVLKDTFGQCAQPLEHRGPVNIHFNETNEFHNHTTLIICNAGEGNALEVTCGDTIFHEHVTFMEETHFHQTVIFFGDVLNVLKRFQLVTDMSNGQATARTLEWDPLTLAYKIDATEKAFEVYDILGKWGSAKTGYWGWATKHSDRRVFEIVQMQNKARFIQGRLATSLNSSISGQALTALVNVSHYYDGQNPGAVVTVNNTLGVFTGNFGARCTATHDPERDEYWLTWVEC